MRLCILFVGGTELEKLNEDKPENPPKANPRRTIKRPELERSGGVKSTLNRMVGGSHHGHVLKNGGEKRNVPQPRQEKEQLYWLAVWHVEPCKQQLCQYLPVPTQ